MSKLLYSWVLLVDVKYVNGLKIGLLGGIILAILNILNIILSSKVKGSTCLIEMIIIIFAVIMGAFVVRSSRGSLKSMMDSIILAGLTGTIAGFVSAVILEIYIRASVGGESSMPQLIFAIFFVVLVFSIIQNMILSVIGGGIYALSISKVK